MHNCIVSDDVPHDQTIADVTLILISTLFHDHLGYFISDSLFRRVKATYWLCPTYKVGEGICDIEYTLETLKGQETRVNTPQGRITWWANIIFMSTEPWAGSKRKRGQIFVLVLLGWRWYFSLFASDAYPTETLPYQCENLRGKLIFNANITIWYHSNWGYCGSSSWEKLLMNFCWCEWEGIRVNTEPVSSTVIMPVYAL